MSHAENLQADLDARDEVGACLKSAGINDGRATGYKWIIKLIHYYQTEMHRLRQSMNSYSETAATHLLKIENLPYYRSCHIP